MVRAKVRPEFLFEGAGEALDACARFSVPSAPRTLDQSYLKSCFSAFARLRAPPCARFLSALTDRVERVRLTRFFRPLALEKARCFCALKEVRRQ